MRRIVKVGDKDVKLSPKEYDLLRVLVQHAGKVLTHRFLLKELWDELTDAQYLRVYVRQLRQKIEADPERPQFVLTETGIGYRLRAPGSDKRRSAWSTMKIPDLLSPTDVMVDVRASNKQQLLQELAAKAADSLGLPVDRVASYLLKREELGSTGIGKGVAIPHARLPDLQRPFGLLAKLKQPIEFDAIDGRAVDIVFVLLLPATAEDKRSARSRWWRGRCGRRIISPGCVARKKRRSSIR